VSSEEASPASPDWDKVRSDFPVNDLLIWLNNCGTTPAGKPMVAAVHRFLEGYSREGTAWGGKSYPGVKSAIYRHLARLLGAAPEEFALVHNTAEGMNFISHGLPLASGDEILVLENEYPSNVYPWEHWRDKGVALTAVPCGAGPGEFLEAFTAALSPRTKVAALSAVHWCSGMPLPLEAIGRLCAGRGVEFVVDGSQGVGLRAVDTKACRIGYMAFSAWKWLLGPLGLGALFISADRLQKLKPIFKGTESVVNDGQYLPYKADLKPTADRFVYSTGNFSDWIWFEASLDYLAGIGFANARDRIGRLAEHLTEGLRGIGWEPASDGFGDAARGGTASGIVAVSRPGVDSAAAVRHLKAQGIIAADRLGRVRFSPHIYNSTAQLDRAVAALADFTG
jgi:cysteine desulfurase/selenocysteine lyase